MAERESKNSDGTEYSRSNTDVQIISADEFPEAKNGDKSHSTNHVRTGSENSLRNESTDNDVLLAETAKKFAGLTCIQHTKELDEFGEIAEEMLSKLEEFLGFADVTTLKNMKPVSLSDLNSYSPFKPEVLHVYTLYSIRGDVNMALGATLDAIYSKTGELQCNFERIDKLEILVSIVKRDLALMESSIDQAEVDLGTINPIKKVFNSISIPAIFAPKSSASQRARGPTEASYKPVRTFQTSDFIASPVCNNSPALCNTLDNENPSSLAESLPLDSEISDVPSNSIDISSGLS